MINIQACWENYLNDLSKNSADEVRQVWNNLVLNTHNIKIPQAIPVGGDLFCFVWKDEFSQLSIQFDISDISEIAWISLNSLTMEIDSGIELLDKLSQTLIKELNYFSDLN